MRTANLDTLLAELTSRLKAIYGDRLVKLVLFGSQARGDAVPGSDIDVLAVLHGPTQTKEEAEKTLDLLVDLSLEYGEVVSLIFMDEQRFINRNGPLLRNIRREGIVI